MSMSVSCLPQYVVFVDGRGPFRYPEIKFRIFLNTITSYSSHSHVKSSNPSKKSPAMLTVRGDNNW